MPANTQSVRSSTRVAIMGSLVLAAVVVFASLVYTTRANIVSSELRAAAAQAERVSTAATLDLGVLGREVEGLATAAPWLDVMAPGGGREATRDAERLFAEAGFTSVGIIGPDGPLYSWGSEPWPMLDDLPADERGFRIASGRVYAVASTTVPVTMDGGKPELRAVFARPADLAEFASAAGISVDAFRVVNSASSKSRQGVLLPSADGSSGVELVRPHTLIIHSYLPDGAGGVAGALSAEVESVGYQGAPQLVGGTVAALLVVGLVWGAATLGLIERFSLSRVVWLRSAVLALGQRRQEGVRLAVDDGARDEISQVAEEINVMLESLEKARRSERRTEMMSRALIDNMVDAVLVLDSQGKVAFANSRACEMAGREPGQLHGALYRDLFAIDAPDPLERLLSGRLRPEAMGIVEARLIRDGVQAWLELSVSTFCSGGRIEAVQLTARDVTDRRRMEQELVWLADHDHLTGLFNRKRFEEEVERAFAEAARTGHGGALLWLDLDGFKSVNDVHGHHAGDDVLISFAEALRETVRSSHVVARIGGDEFAVLLTRVDATDAECVAYRILDGIRSRVVEHEGKELRVTASLGIALFPQDGSSISELLSRADIAMYQAKASGKATARRYSVDEDRERLLQGRQAWGAKIEQALRDDRFTPYCQPIVHLTTGMPVRHELLVRLLDGDDIVVPGEFLGHAEELGLVNRIDSWMLDRAIAMVRRGLRSGEAPHLSINLSGHAFSDSGFLESIYDRLVAHPEVCPYIGFEITETSLIQHMLVAAEFTDRVKAMGCVMCLDDFGSGFSSFYYLRHLPVEVLKIDRELVRNVTRTKKDTRLVAAISDMARSLGMSVVAEGVEDRSTADVLVELGVQMAQGHLLGMPCPASHLDGQAQGVAGVADGR